MLILSGIAKRARVVELADSLASGASARKGVRVQVPPRAPKRQNPAVLETAGFFLVFFDFLAYAHLFTEQML